MSAPVLVAKKTFDIPGDVHVALTTAVCALEALKSFSWSAVNEDDLQHEYLTLTDYVLGTATEEIQAALAAIESGDPYQDCLADLRLRRRPKKSAD